MLILIWVIAGIIAPELAMVVIPLTLMLLKNKGRYAEIIVAFAILLYFSDNRKHEFAFAGKTKDIALVLVSAFVMFDSKQFFSKSKFWYPFAAFFAVASISMFRNPLPMLAFQKTLSFALMFIYIPNYFTREIAIDRGERMLKLWIWSGTLLYVVALGLSRILPENYTYLVGRYNGLLGNPNGIGSFSTVFFIMIMLTLQKHPKMFTKPQLVLIFGSLILSVLMSGSRNCIFSILIFLFFSRFYKISYWVGFVIVIVVAILFQIINENLPAIINAFGLGDYFRVDHLEDGSGRLIAWTFGWQEIQNNFMLGRGFSYEETLFEENKYWLNDLGHLGGVHNTFLALWLNTGIIGLIVYLVGFFKNFFKAASVNYMALPTMFAILFSCMFEAWFQGSLNPFTIIAILNITLLQHVDTTQEKDTIPVL
ncbi:MAG TPA: O-antigen ligase family protein [Bacteroidia bacterium]|nr:O-antigen ligase family protein [Bacteroidia bacterium]HQK96892.1 O-antigen ligase family protein [Bacteroidia bacterium]